MIMIDNDKVISPADTDVFRRLQDVLKRSQRLTT